MIFSEKFIKLKNGKTGILRSPQIGDGAKMLEYIKTACGETDFLLRYPEEWEGVSVESEEKWIKNSLDSESTLMIVCYIDGEVAGNCEIRFHFGVKTSHRASIAIAVLQKYWNLGIGSAMFTELIDCAKLHKGTEIVELEFIEGNDRARTLYEKFGFEIVGQRPNAFKLKDGNYAGEFFMQKVL